MAYFIPDNLMPAVRNLPRLLRWIQNLRVQGDGVAFQNTPDGATITIRARPVQKSETTAGGDLFPVKLTQTGGDAGDRTTQCSFTYTVKDHTDTRTLATGVALTGNGNRVVNAAMTAGTYGMAYWDGTTLVLLWADERITQHNCS